MFFEYAGNSPHRPLPNSDSNCGRHRSGSDVIEQLDVGIIVVGTGGRVETCNRAAAVITGIIPEQACGQAVDRVFEGCLDDDAILSVQSILTAGGKQRIETRIRAKGHPAGRDVCLSVSPLDAPDGQTAGVVVTLKDITPVKKAEAQTERTERLAAMGEMATRMAHEIRNPLGSMELFASVLQKKLAGFGELETMAQHISAGIRSIDSIISNLLLYVRPHQTTELAAMDLYAALEDSLFFSRHLFPGNQRIHVNKDFCPGPLRVQGDLELLKQMFLNLILNAIQAMPEGGQLAIRTRTLPAAEKGRVGCRVCISDTGVGISPENLKKVFNPFYTTKPKGTGIGMAIVHNIVNLHAGKIEISSSPGSGTQCVIDLPLLEDLPTADVTCKGD